MADGTLRKLCMSHSPVNGADFCGGRGEGDGSFQVVWRTDLEVHLERAEELIGPMSTPQCSMSLACVRATETMPSQGDCLNKHRMTRGE